MPRLCKIRFVPALGLILVMTASSGCVPLVVGGVVAAGGAAGYAYYAGELNREFDTGAAEVRLAARAALTEMGMPIIEEHSDPNGGWLVTKTTVGERVSLTFNDFPDQTSPAGFITRVGVRVSAFGDAPFSRELLDQIGTRLGAAPAGAPPAGAPPGIGTARLTPQPQPLRPGESPPPPLAVGVAATPQPGSPAASGTSPPTSAPVQQAGWRQPQK